MGGKTGTTTQSVQIPKEVLARYNAVNSQAQSVASTPFQKYSTDPNDFVAGINQQQYAGIGGINRAANMAQPSIAYAQQGLTGEGYQQGVQQYMNPYLQNAMGATAAQMNNVNQQQQNQLAGNAISAGAFGGDRAGIARNNLINQQNLAMGQTLGNMANQGYQQSAQNYMQGMGQIGQLGLQGQQAALQGAQAQLGAGTLEQQTQQAGQTALYNQFLQQQAYPFQVAQFLANIAMGTGGLSGSTTTTTQPMPFFSDRRLKKNIERIGQTDEGLPIHKFEYKGDPKGQKHIGLMADEVEQIHPEAVGTHKSGYKVVDYDRATSEGGAVGPQHAGLGFAAGGDVAAGLNAMNAMQANMPVTTGGVDAGLAGAAQAIAPQPNVPQSVFYEPSYNVFADPKYQPDLNGGGGGGGRGDKNGQNNQQPHDDHRPTRGNEGNGGGNRTDPFSDRSYSVDSNGMMHGSETGWSNNYDPTQGAAFAHGGRAGYALQGAVQGGDNPYDPYSIQNIISRQIAMYNNLEGHHVPSGRSLAGGIGKYGRVPQSNLPVSQLKQAGAAPSLPDSMLKQGLDAGTQIADLGTKATDLYKYYNDEKDKDKKAHGGLAGFALGGDTSEKDDKSTPVDELYSAQKTDATKRDILANMDKSKLPEAGKAPTPTSQTGLSLGEAASLGKTLGSFILPFFLKDGGRAGYDVGGALTEEEIMKRAAYDPTLVGSKLRGVQNIEAPFLRPSDVRQTATDTPDIYSREAQPAAAPRLRYFQERMNRRGNENVLPTDIHRSAEESAGLDLTMPEGAPRAKPFQSGHNYGLSGDFSGINKSSLPDAREVAAEAGLTLGADFKNPDYPHVQVGKGSYGGLRPQYGKNIDIKPGFLEESHSGAVPAEDTEAAYANARLPSGRSVSGAPPKEGAESTSFLDSIFGSKPRRGPDSDRTTSTDMLLSILSGVGSMASSNSPYLGAAILQGIGGGAKTYAGLRNQQSEMALRESEMLKNTMGLLNDRFQPLPDGKGFYDLWTGEKVGPEARASVGMQMGLPPSFFGMGEKPSGLGGVEGTGQPRPQQTSGLGVKTEPTKETEKSIASGLNPPAAEERRPVPAATTLPQTRPMPEPAATTTTPPEVRPQQTATSEAPVVNAEEDAYQKKIQLLQQKARDVYASVDQDPRVKPYVDAISENKQKIAGLEDQINTMIQIPRFAEQRANLTTQLQAEKTMLQSNIAAYQDVRNKFAEPQLKPINEELTRLAASSPSVVAAETGKLVTGEQAKKDLEVAQKGADFVQEYQGVKQTIDGLINAYTKIDMNRLSDIQADMIGFVKSVPALDKALRDYAGLDVDEQGFQGLSDAAQKEAVTQAFRQLGKATTNMQLQESLATVAEPTRAPAAKYSVVTKQVARLNQMNDMYQDFISREDKNQSWPKFQVEWSKNPDHSISTYEQNAVNSVPYFAGMTLNDINKLSYKNDNLRESNDGTKVKDIKTGVIWDAATGKVIKGPDL